MELYTYRGGISLFGVKVYITFEANEIFYEYFNEVELSLRDKMDFVLTDISSNLKREYLNVIH